MNIRTPGRSALLAATLVTLVATGCGQKGPLVKPAAKQAKPVAAPVDPTAVTAPGISIPSSSTPGPSAEMPVLPVK